MSRHGRLTIPQSSSHLHLLGGVTAPWVPLRATHAPDAIIVPAARRADNLEDAIALASAVRSRLVVLCSKEARPAEALRLLEARSFRKALVIDLPDDYAHPLFLFQTSAWAAAKFPERKSDLSLKRNIGLALARLCGWRRVFFMDDDIHEIHPAELLGTMSLLDGNRASLTKFTCAGLLVREFPDNSVACYAHRLTKEDQEVFISGSVLAVDCTASFGFFPDIYNEDWLFFYQDALNRRLANSGFTARQREYDPFASPQRAAGQEFGDVIAEGLYALLEHGTKAGGATRGDWEGFLANRAAFLDDILKRRDDAPPDVRDKMVAAIEAAQRSLSGIQPDTCMEYVRLWQEDLLGWTNSIGQLTYQVSASAALARLKLAASTSRPHGQPPLPHL